MYARLTLTILLGVSFFNCRGQDTLGVYKEIIQGITSCETIYIRENANFSGISFKNEALFPCNRFLNIAGFGSAQFNAQADFYNAQFESRAYFRLAQFNSRAYFRLAQFKSLADFYNTQFNARAYFRSSQFESRVDFRLAQFKSLADFNSAQFDARANFSLSQYDSLADFSSAQFHAQVDLSSVQFHALTEFNSAQFDAQANFYEAQFDARANFRLSQFRSIADFSASQFDARVNFSTVHFHSQANFSSAQFKSQANFESAQFDAHVDFSNAQFHAQAYFSQASFNGKTNFRGATLPETLYFNNIKEIHKDEIIDFTFCELDSFQTSCAIDLVDTEISKIKLNYSSFQLIFPDSNYTFRKKSNTYEQLLKTQKDYGFTTGYENLDKEYKEFKYIYHPSNNSSFITRCVNFTANVLQKYWWDYGYKKSKILWWSLFFWSIFSIINWLFFDVMNKGVYEIDYIFNPHKKHAKYIKVGLGRMQYKFNIGLQQIVPAVIYTALIFFGLKISVEKINYKNIPGAIYIYSQYLLGLVCIAFIANYIILS